MRIRSFLPSCPFLSLYPFDRPKLKIKFQDESNEEYPSSFEFPTTIIPPPLPSFLSIRNNQEEENSSKFPSIIPPFPSKSQISIPLRLAHPCSFRLSSGYSPLPLIQPLPSPLIPLPPRSPPVSPPHSSPSPLPFLRNREPLSAERGVCLQIRRTYTIAPVCTATLHAEGRVAVAVRQGPGERRTILESYPRLKIFRSFLFSPSFFQRNERISRPS